MEELRTKEPFGLGSAPDPPPTLRKCRFLDRKLIRGLPDRPLPRNNGRTTNRIKQ